MIATSGGRNRRAWMFNAIATCAGISLLIAGCPGVVQPTPTPTASPTASPTPTPTASPSPTASPTPTPTASPTPTPAPRLYIGNITGNSVISYADPSTVNGNIAPDTNLSGAQSQISGPADMVVNSADQLIVSNIGSQSITTYDNAASANGNLAPDGNVQGAATQLMIPNTLAINAGQDLVFVGDNVTSNILVFEGSAQATFNGNLAPVRTIISNDLNDPIGINFGANDNLYVANNAGNDVTVFAGASALNGNVNATRVITSALFANLLDVFIDPDDTMFVVSANGFVLIFNNASTLNGNVAPDFTLNVPGAPRLTAIAVDSAGTGYIVEQVANAVVSYDNIATLNGTIAPDRTIQGANTQLNLPTRVFLTE